MTSPAVKTIAPSSSNVLRELAAGNKRFLSGTSNKSSEMSLSRLKYFAEHPQAPKAIVLCCSDARAPVEMIFDQDIGDLFVIRVAGNIIAPSLIGSIEFAASTFGTKLVLVMGHTQCGAIKATLDYIEHPLEISSENIHDIVSRIRPTIFPVATMQDLSFDEKVNKAVELNVLASVERLSHSSRLIEDMAASRQLAIHGAIFDVATGAVRFLDI